VVDLLISASISLRFELSFYCTSAMFTWWNSLQDQANIHRKCFSKAVEDRWEAARLLGIHFSTLPNKAEAWNDLHWLAQDNDSIVLSRAIKALKTAFSQVPDKALAWQDLLQLTHARDGMVRWTAAASLGQIFPHVPDKSSAWKDLHSLSNQIDDSARWGAAVSLGRAFRYIPDKNQAWQDLCRLIDDDFPDLRVEASEYLGEAFPHVPDKNQALIDLIGLAKCKDKNVRWCAIEALGQVFSYIPDKDLTWQVLLDLAMWDFDRDLRRGAIVSLGRAFPYISNKDQAWRDLLGLTESDNSYVQRGVVVSLGLAFPYIPDKGLAWQVFHRFMESRDKDVRRDAATSLGQAFSQVPDKSSAWRCLYELTKDKDSDVRRGAIISLGQAFPYIPDKSLAWQVLDMFTNDANTYVRMHAYYSLGRASVFKSTEAEDKDTLKKELEAAVAYFEKSSHESSISSARFCHPFYRSYLAITFQEAKEDEVQKYLTEAKEAVGISRSKDELLKAVENLAGALQAAQCLNDRSVQEVASELNAYRWYCEKAAEHMAAAEDQAPGAVKLLKKCNPLIEERIQNTITEIQEKARQICQVTRGRRIDYETFGDEINKAAKLLSSADIYSMQKNISIIVSQLEEFCKLLPDNSKRLACKTVKEMQSTKEIPDKLDKMKLALSYIYPVVEVSLQVKDMHKDLQKEIREATKTVLDHLDKNQRFIVEAVLNALDRKGDQDQQFKELLGRLEAVVDELESEQIDDTAMKKDIEKVAKYIKDPELNIKNRLVCTIPIIPILLTYQGIIEYQSGLNLLAAWNKLTSSLRS